MFQTKWIICIVVNVGLKCHEKFFFVWQKVRFTAVESYVTCKITNGKYLRKINLRKIITAFSVSQRPISTFSSFFLNLFFILSAFCLHFVSIFSLIPNFCWNDSAYRSFPRLVDFVSFIYMLHSMQHKGGCPLSVLTTPYQKKCIWIPRDDFDKELLAIVYWIGKETLLRRPVHRKCRDRLIFGHCPLQHILKHKVSIFVCNW